MYLVANTNLMNTIRVTSLPLKDVLRNIADALETTVSQDCEEYTLALPQKFGQGSIKGMNFKDGLGLIFFDCTFKEDMEIQFIVNKVHPLKFLFCVEGSLNHRFENEKASHNIQAFQNAIVASCDTHGHILQFHAGVHTCINSLEINRKEFQPYMECRLDSLDEELELLFGDVFAKEVFYHKGNYCIKMAGLFEELQNFTSEDFARKMFLSAVSFHILVLQILQYQDDRDRPEEESILRKSEIKRIKEAAFLINNEILDFTSVVQLAEKVGLNSNKLQDGFKTIYKTTVNGYVQDRRLDLATTLLKNSDYSISEIVYMIGLSSKSYFSKIFKEKYHLSPSLARKKTS